MTPGRTHTERGVQAHGWPLAAWPQAIVLAGERIDHHSHFNNAGGNFALMTVMDHVATLSLIRAPREPPTPENQMRHHASLTPGGRQ